MTEQGSHFAIVLEHSFENQPYLTELSNRVGFRYVLASHTDVFGQLIEIGLPASLFIIRFERQLNHYLKSYMQVLNEPLYSDVPVLLIANENTQQQAETILERSIDGVILSPINIDQMAVRTGSMLRRSMRQSVDLKVWLMLDGRAIEGRTLDVSATGVSIMIPDPILAKKFTLRVFPDPELSDVGVDFAVLVRRKERVPEGGYYVGLEIEEHLDGDLELLRQASGVQFRL